MTPTSKRPLSWGLSLHQHGRMASWRTDNETPFDRIDLATHTRLAQAAEDSGFDFVFLADVLKFQHGWGDRGALGGTEPITLLSAVAAVTSRIGLVASVSTTFSAPFTVARQLASLDHLSDGRVGWNIVTSYAGERNYGLKTLPTQEDRYAQAEEFVNVASQLWHSWGEQPFVGDRSTGVLADYDSIRPVNYSGRFFEVEGPLDIQPSPQVQPVIFQAGASPVGKDFAARHAEVVFAAAQQKDALSEFAADLRARAVGHGRDTNDLKVIPGVTIYLSDTDDSAHRRYRDLVELSDIEAGVRGLSGLLTIDLSGQPLDRPIDPDLFPSYAAHDAPRRSRPELFEQLSREGVPLQRLAEVFLSSHGHHEVIGSAATVAADLEEWATDTGIDGFIISLGFGPGDIDLVTSELAPELARRGLLAPAAAGATTFRERLFTPRDQSIAS